MVLILMLHTQHFVDSKINGFDPHAIEAAVLQFVKLIIIHTQYESVVVGAQS